MKRYAPDACDPGLNEDPDGEYVRYDDANAEAADLSADLHAREQRCQTLTEEVERQRIKIQFLEARIRGLEALVNRTADTMDAYLKTRGQ